MPCKYWSLPSWEKHYFNYNILKFSYKTCAQYGMRVNDNGMWQYNCINLLHAVIIMTRSNCYQLPVLVSLRIMLTFDNPWFFLALWNIVKRTWWPVTYESSHHLKMMITSCVPVSFFHWKLELQWAYQMANKQKMLENVASSNFNHFYQKKNSQQKVVTLWVISTLGIHSTLRTKQATSASWRRKNSSIHCHPFSNDRFNQITVILYLTYIYPCPFKKHFVEQLFTDESPSTQVFFICHNTNSLTRKRKAKDTHVHW